MSRGRLVEDLVYDVGLHRGEDAAFYMAMGYRVVGFEADPGLAADCRARFSDELRSGQFALVEGAISALPQATVAFYRHATESVWGTTNEAWASRNVARGASAPIEVPVVDFERCLATMGVPWYMKVDLEGADTICYDALNSFRVRPKYVSLESEKNDFAALVEEFDLLQRLGYDRFAVVQQCGVETRTLTTVGYHGRVVHYKFEPDASGPFGADVGPWITRDEALERYRTIFRAYRYFGDGSLIQRTTITRKLRDRWSMVRGIMLPGWYDTHAMRE